MHVLSFFLTEKMAQHRKKWKSPTISVGRRPFRVLSLFLSQDIWELSVSGSDLLGLIKLHGAPCFQRPHSPSCLLGMLIKSKANTFLATDALVSQSALTWGYRVELTHPKCMASEGEKEKHRVWVLHVQDRKAPITEVAVFGIFLFPSGRRQRAGGSAHLSVRAPSQCYYKGVGKAEQRSGQVQPGLYWTACIFV